MRRLFKLISLASLALAVIITFAICQRHREIAYAFPPDSAGQTWILIGTRGTRISIVVQRFASGTQMFSALQPGFHRYGDYLRLLVVGHLADPRGPHFRTMSIISGSFPLWPLLVLAATASIACIFLWLRKRKPAPGCCLMCGYDLRASPDRCPECGNPKTQPPKS